MELFSHHAHVLSGDGATLLPLLHKHLSDAGVVIHGNPDALSVAVHSLSIDDARALYERTRTSVSPENRRIVIVSCVQATVEAQNALLKLIEEPGLRTHFFFIVPNEDMLLPTLRSRLEHLTLPRQKEAAPDADAFLRASFAKRMEGLAECLEEKRHDEALTLLNGIEEQLSKDTAQYKDALDAVETARTYVLRRGSSLKLVLEYLALCVPKLS